MSGNTRAQNDATQSLLGDSPVPRGIYRTRQGETEFYVVEDVAGRPLAFTSDPRVARLIFAAPGMLNTLGDLAATIERFNQNGCFLPPTISNDLLEVLKDASDTLHAAMRTTIETRSR